LAGPPFRPASVFLSVKWGSSTSGIAGADSETTGKCQGPLTMH
jgi:hypothetical protein